MKSLVTVNCIDDVYGDVLDVDKLDADLSNGSLDASRSEHCRNKHRLFMFEVGIELESPIHESFSKLEDLEDGGYLQRSALDPSMSIIHYKGRQLPVRLHSFLGQGIYIALMRYLRMLRRPGARHVDAACIPRGMNVEIVDDPTVVLRILHEHNLDSYTGTSTLAVGTSDFATCYRQVGELVHATLDGQVSYGSDVSLYGTENFISLLRDLSLPVDGSLKVTPRVLLDLAQGVCAEDKATLFTILPSTVRVQHMCFGLTFLALLSKAISGLGDDAEIIVKDRIHDTPASWTIGTVLLELPMVLRKSL
ncbi:hypothetical protein X943_001104 [Babesia divergens]|uniref:Uncharacterized protein n=1 Tax=Babesia divergens TaxID=32595 RepID=A0AAD9G6P6_BABDI|nr:hypothetical protein X943_001104 [Babesia divergens]